MKKNIVNSDLQNIPESKNWIEGKEILKGWSKDKKYYVKNKKEEEFLVRVSNIETYENKKAEFEIMSKVFNKGILISEPIELGKFENKVYGIFSWIKGEDLSEVIKKYSQEEQYNFGIETGKILKKLHNIKAPKNIEIWETKMNKKIYSHLEKYKKSGISINNEDIAIKYIEENLFLLKDRPQVFQHGDFHIGNMILTSNNNIGVIDFNRWDYGDPYEEFYKMMLFSRELSIPFVKGKLDSYFDKKIPKLFWNLLALYLADVILFSVVWAIPFGEKEVEGMKKRSEMILNDYNNFENIIPKWFE